MPVTWDSTYLTNLIAEAVPVSRFWVFTIVSSPSFLFPSASVSWRAAVSPVSCPAPVPGEVAVAASAVGASFFCVRPSSRSVSCWVAVAFFSSPAASAFAASVADLCGFPFCVVRSVGQWQLVLVPVAVSGFESAVGSLPCLFAAF